MNVKQLNAGPCRTYLVTSSAGDAVLVDPVFGSVESYLGVIADERLTLRYVIDTHSHADHASGGALLQERTEAEYVMHAKSPVRPVTKRLSDGSAIALGDLTLEIIETPGHTKDSVSVKLPGAILTGDWLFIGGAGRTDLPGGDPGEHWESLQKVIPRLPDDTVIYPAHDYQGKTSSPLGVERGTNPNLVPRSRREYEMWLHGLKQPTPAWMVKMLELNYAGVTDPKTDLSFRPEDTPACMACQPNLGVSSMPIPTVSVDELRKMQSDNEAPVVLDVRQPDEYVGPLGHIPGAVLVPLPELAARISELERHREKTIVAVCRTGARSLNAATLLTSAGFKSVFNLVGGTQAWFERGFPVER